MFYYLAQVERDFYRRVFRASIIFLFIGLLLGVCFGVYAERIQTKFNREKIQAELTQKKEVIADLESALGIKQGKHKPGGHGREGKRK